MNQETREVTAVTVRQLRQDDLEGMIALDEKNTGSRRDAYLELKLRQALHDTGVQVSLAAELDGVFVGFLLSRVYYGEFGAPEPVAVLDTLDVAPAVRGRGVGSALLRQLRTNLLGLGVDTLRTEVGWEDRDLVAFFQRVGFQPAPRLCLDLDLARARLADECEEAGQG